MESLNNIIDHCTQSLSKVTADNLTPTQLDSSLATLKSVDLDEAVNQYWRSLPAKPENLQEQPGWENKMHQKGKELNHQLKGFNDELSRIKTMQAALHIPQLDVLIHAAQDVLRPMYDFSARLSQ